MSTAIGIDDAGKATTVDPVTGTATATPTPKVVASTTGGAVGAAVAVIGVYVIELTTGVDIPTLVEGAVTVVVTGALAFVGGYFKRP